jgi:AcrR family transcriptional regulator
LVGTATLDTVAWQPDRRERILTAAARLFAAKGVAATTVREIADEVGILSGSLYHHFESKDAMADEIISGYLEDLRTRYKHVLARDSDPRTRLCNLVTASLETAQAHPYATEIYQNDANYLRSFERFGYLQSAGKEVQSTWLSVIEAGIAEGTFRSDIDSRVFYRLIRDSVWMSVRWYKPSRDYPIGRLAEDCTTIFLDGLTT